MGTDRHRVYGLCVAVDVHYPDSGGARAAAVVAAGADPGQTQPGVINHRDGGRGLYFEDPDGHLLEIITRPYGSGS